MTHFPFKNLQRFQFPVLKPEVLASWVTAGLAVEANPDDESGIIFQREWGTKQFNHFLRNLFSVLFQYLGTFNQHVLQVANEPDNVGLKRIDYSWPYVLLQKDRKKYDAVDHTHPTGVIFRDNLSGRSSGASFRGKGIFLGTSPPSLLFNKD